MKRLILLIGLLLVAPVWAATPFPEAVSTSTTTLTLQPTVGVYTFTGSSPATWTLPAVSGNKDRQIIIKNRGSATITVQRAGSDQLYTTSAVTSTTVTAGGWAKFVNDGVYWAVLTAGSGGLASTDIDTSAELAAILGDETGSGAAVFGTSPTFNTSINIGGNCLLYPDGSNVLSLRNGANAQAFNIYNTWGNSGTDYERLFVGWTGNYCYLTTQRAGTGFARSIIVGTEGVTAMYLRTGGLDRWSVIGSGHLTAVTDNTYDIGASGATRPRSIYAGTNVETPAMSGTNTKTLTETTDTAFVNVTCATDTVVGGIIQYTIQADDGGAFQTRAGSIPFSLYKAGGSAAAGSFGTAADVVNTSSGTLTATWTVTGSGSTASLKCNATSSLTQTTLNIKYRVIINGPAVTVTPQ